MLTNRERDGRHAATPPSLLPREHHTAAAHGQGLLPADLSALWKDFRPCRRAAGQLHIRSQSRVMPLRGAHQSGAR
ncbi:hypothetical protein [Xylella taiwanensis]|uniref:Uncharacterized protein n=1 Tax=Xylella taiwanensis TaxID=1444770 RepID=A0ABS8TU78_9GAMM|nr:hypothetical protein [Xylella taiwanensis]MCD8455289.1 hypothetical protein [Xylella taiwanensis]MCD8457696.1 hypothetical protein [Xylella taiwanensis]MCD8459833.1 hypothetical protein [Xylella taiwanensis]MCD8464106.1 hypothetical protein [Xylella taiwanensis]MCD8464336.1 hypothetical protein [Xylella taiwanensis]